MNGLYDIDAYLTGPALLGALAAFGLIVGILTGLFGVGGGFVVVPLLNLVFGIKYDLAVGSSLAFIVGKGAVGVVLHARARNVVVRAVVFLAVGASVGVLLGAALLEHLKNALGEAGSVNFQSVMHGLFIIVLLITAVLLLRGPVHEKGGSPLLQRLPLGPYIDLPAAGLKHISLPGLCLAGLGAGILMGLLGLGGGVLFVPVLILAVGLSPHQAVGTSLGAMLFAAAVGAVKHATYGNVNLPVALALLAGGLVGVGIGTWVCRKLHATRLRRYFAILVLLVAAALVWDLVR